jgi:hypothetical protein
MLALKRSYLSAHAKKKRCNVQASISHGRVCGIEIKTTKHEGEHMGALD